MKSRNFLLIFIFGLSVFLLPSFAEAACPITCQECHWNMRSDSYCWGKPDDDFIVYEGAGVERVGTIGDVVKSVSDGFWEDPLCYYENKACANKIFPPGAGYNGQVCKAWDRCAAPTCADGWGGSDCIQSGHWDASESQCVSCNGKKEEWVRGDTSDIYAGCSGFPSGCNDPGIQGTNYGKCESACGASPQCDEKTYGSNVSVSGGVCNYCVFTASKPDLIITDIWPDGNTIRYTIKNQGNASAGSSNSYLYVDGSYKTSDSVSSLSAGASSNESFSYDWIANCSGTSDTIKVCADGGGAVSESNEGNNCREEVWDCPQPDLVITDIWENNNRIYYTIKNQGDADADSSYSYLYIEGSYEDDDYVSSLAAGDSDNEYFPHNWICSKPSDVIKVCADAESDITESNETNNCLEVTLDCPPADLQITDIWFESNKKVYYRIYNYGTGNADDSKSALYVNGTYKTYDNVSALNDNTGREEHFSGWTCTGGVSYSIKVCADKDDVVVESNETNNCRTENLTCPLECSGILNVSISGSGTCTVTADLVASGCDGQAWKVKDNGTIKCSGTVSGSPYSYTCSNWTVGVGTYTYNLYIGGVNKDSDSVTCSETPNNPPTCDYLSASPASGNAPLDVIFTASGSDSDGTIVEYEFDFGDGSDKVYSSTAGVTHTYNAVGTYCAKLRVKDDDGAWSINTGNCPGGTCTVQITVTEAGLGVSPPEVRTVPISEQGTVTTDSATIWGELTDIGGAVSCLVWFEYKKSADEVWTKDCETTITSTGSFSCPLTELTSNTTYDFEAFAKNGGSW